MKSQRHLVNGLTSVRIFALVGLLVTVQLTILAHADAQTSGTWTNTGSLNTARSGHTATLLPNGQVLVAGGTTRTVLSLAPSCITRQQVSGWSLAA
jgi:hypothetical protein